VVETADVARTLSVEGAAATIRTRVPRRLRNRPIVIPVLVLVVGLVITAGLAWLAQVASSRNETRLLRSQVRQTAALLQAVVPTVQTPLASAAEIASSSGGSSARFASYLTTYLGARGPFVAAVLFTVSGTSPRPLSTAGRSTALSPTSASVTRIVTAAARSHQLELIGPIPADPDRIGYAYASTRTAPAYVVYAESLLPLHRRAVIQRGSPFANLRFALYLGSSTGAAHLLETNVASLPLTGRTASTTLAFGATTLTLVAGTANPLGGTISSALWWIIAAAGALLTLVGAFTAHRLVASQEAAERLTIEVRSLLGQQRSIAEALQQALLPRRLPSTAELNITARYVPGTHGVEIGGDWYDVMQLDDHRYFFVVGDVSGRGVDAGAVMASLQFAIRGFVSEGHQPVQVLDALTRLLDVQRDQHFATVLCGVVDLLARTLTLASAGHLPPLLVSDDRTEFIVPADGPPIGVAGAGRYAATSVPIPAEATLLAYTDGLVERRGETLDDGLRRLMNAAQTAGLAGEELVNEIMRNLLPDGCDDDTAVLALRWPA
jgi:Serine phosphatase RsbU, regulator of sigma subunit